MLVNFLMGMLMTFTVYNPANNSLTQVVNSILAPNSGIVVVPNSIRLKYGSGYGETSTNLQSSVSFYDGSIAALGIGPGLLLTSGDGKPALLNTSSGYSVELTPSETDASLTQAVQTAFEFAGEVQDASTLEFQFTVNNPALTGIRFDLVFGSDEFPEYVDSSFVDIAGVFVNGVNYALFNGNSNQPLSVIGTNLAQGGFQDNTSGALPIEYDGIMRLVSVVVPVQQGVNTLKIGVADTGDQILDSGLFVSNVRAVPYASGGLLTVVNGTGGNDVLTGLGFNELLDGGAGNDTIRGNGGNDLIVGGAGKDISAYTPEINYLGVRVEAVTRLTSPNYSFIDLRLAPDVAPGTIQIGFKRGAEKIEFAYNLFARDKNSAMRKSFSNADVILNFMPDRFSNGDPSNDNLPGFLDPLNRADDSAGRHGGAGTAAEKRNRGPDARAVS